MYIINSNCLVKDAGLKVAICFSVLALLLIGCANRQPSYSNSYSNNSVPAVQYDFNYRPGCNKAIYTISSESYNGAYCYGKKKGAGIATYQNPPSKYDGMFDNDLRNGYGVYTWTKSGDKYAGYWSNDVRTGFGTYTWGSDGSYESGYWLNSKQEGEHKWFYKNGTQYGTRTYKGGVLMSKSIIGSPEASPEASPKKSYSDPNIKIQKCKRLGLVEGSEDYKLCLKSVKN